MKKYKKFQAFFVFQICFATNYMADEHFDTIVAVNLTGLLVMVTLFNDATTKYGFFSNKT